MAEFKRLDFAAIPGGATAACERLPNLPAIYAFFAPMPALPTKNKDAFVEALGGLVAQRASPVLNTKAGSLHHITLENYSVLSPHKVEVLDGLADDEATRQEIADLVRKCMELRSPLYVGQTATLHDRVKQHLYYKSKLSLRLSECDIGLHSCVLSYSLMPDMDIFKSSDALQFAEEVITRILRPGFVARIG